jgi:heat shock protein HslJ
MKSLRLFALGAAGVVAMTACGDSSPDPSAQSAATDTATAPSAASTAASVAPTTVPPTTAAPDLATSLGDRTFLSTAVEGFTLVDGTRIALAFEGPNLGASGGCNQLAGTWSVEGDVLVVPPMAQTEMACEPPALMDQDTWLASVLTSRPTLTVDGVTLTIAAPGATVTLVDQEVAHPDRPLEGTVWTVDTLVSDDAASSLPTGASPPTLTFEGGTVSVGTGCNTGSGSYTIAGDAVTFGPIATTRMACIDPAGQQVEQQVLTVLTGTATTAIDADTLTLTNGTEGLVARAAADEPAVPDGLVGPTWQLESATAAGAEVPAGERVPTLAFDGATVAVDAGCNTGSGGYTSDATTITFQPIAMTLMLCADPGGTMETTILGALTGTATYELGPDGALTVTNADTTLRYVPG